MVLAKHSGMQGLKVGPEERGSKTPVDMIEAACCRWNKSQAGGTQDGWWHQRSLTHAARHAHTTDHRLRQE